MIRRLMDLWRRPTMIEVIFRELAEAELHLLESEAMLESASAYVTMYSDRIQRLRDRLDTLNSGDRQ